MSTPSREHAAGMLEAIVAGHECGEACTGTVVIGKDQRGGPSSVRLTCPWDRIDLDNPADRRAIQGVYAAEARAALGKTSRK